MEHSAQDYVRFETANEPEQFHCPGTHARSLEAMNSDPGSYIIRADLGICDQSQVQFVLLSGESSRQERCHLFCSAATKVGDEHENP
jgi:hypothetical protein